MNQLQPLALPPYPFKITEANGQLTMFDELRKKTVIITPEEWVRQHFVQYLINQKNYPKTLMRLEGGLKVNTMARRTDIVIFSRTGERTLIVECKAPSVAITQKVFDQIARYNMAHKVTLLAVTNGLQHYYCRVNHVTGTYQFIEDLPVFGEV